MQFISNVTNYRYSGVLCIADLLNKEQGKAESGLFILIFMWIEGTILSFSASVIYIYNMITMFL